MIFSGNPHFFWFTIVLVWFLNATYKLKNKIKIESSSSEGKVERERKKIKYLKMRRLGERSVAIALALLFFSLPSFFVLLSAHLHPPFLHAGSRSGSRPRSYPFIFMNPHDLHVTLVREMELPNMGWALVWANLECFFHP